MSIKLIEITSRMFCNSDIVRITYNHSIVYYGELGGLPTYYLEKDVYGIAFDFDSKVPFLRLYISD